MRRPSNFFSSSCALLATIFFAVGCDEPETKKVYVHTIEASTVYKPIRVNEQATAPSTAPSSVTISREVMVPQSNTLNSFNVDRRVEQLSQSAQGRQVLRGFIEDNGGANAVLGTSDGQQGDTQAQAPVRQPGQAVTGDRANEGVFRALIAGQGGAGSPQLVALPSNTAQGQAGNARSTYTSPYVSLDSVSTSGAPPVNQRPLGTNATGTTLQQGVIGGGTQAYETNRLGSNSPTIPGGSNTPGVLSRGTSTARGTVANPGSSTAPSLSPTIPGGAGAGAAAGASAGAPSLSPAIP